MEAPSSLSIDEIQQREQDKLDAVNRVLEERTRKEWRAKQWDQRTLAEILVAVRKDVVDAWIDITEKNVPAAQVLLGRPDRWVSIGAFLLGIGLLVYIIDLLG